MVRQLILVWTKKKGGGAGEGLAGLSPPLSGMLFKHGACPVCAWGGGSAWAAEFTAVVLSPNHTAPRATKSPVCGVV